MLWYEYNPNTTSLEKYEAYIIKDNEVTNLGTYKTKEEAQYVAYKTDIGNNSLDPTYMPKTYFIPGTLDKVINQYREELGFKPLPAEMNKDIKVDKADKYILQYHNFRLNEQGYAVDENGKALTEYLFNFNGNYRFKESDIKTNYQKDNLMIDSNNNPKRRNLDTHKGKHYAYVPYKDRINYHLGTCNDKKEAQYMYLCGLKNLGYVLTKGDEKRFDILNTEMSKSVKKKLRKDLRNKFDLNIEIKYPKI